MFNNINHLIFVKIMKEKMFKLPIVQLVMSVNVIKGLYE